MATRSYVILYIKSPGVSCRAGHIFSPCLVGVEPNMAGKKHPLIQNRCVPDVPRVYTKLMLATGSYILQLNRFRFNQNEIDDATCQLCHQANETLKHFILDCAVLEPARRPALDAIQGLVCVIFERPIRHFSVAHYITICPSTETYFGLYLRGVMSAVTGIYLFRLLLNIIFFALRSFFALTNSA